MLISAKQQTDNFGHQQHHLNAWAFFRGNLAKLVHRSLFSRSDTVSSYRLTPFLGRKFPEGYHPLQGESLTFYELTGILSAPLHDHGTPLIFRRAARGPHSSRGLNYSLHCDPSLTRPRRQQKVRSPNSSAPTSALASLSPCSAST